MWYPPMQIFSIPEVSSYNELFQPKFCYCETQKLNEGSDFSSSA